MTSLVPLSDRVSSSPQISVAEVAEIARLGYTAIINNRPDHEDPGQPTGAEIAAEAERQGLDYHFIPVTAPSLSRDDVDAFSKAVAESRGPVLAYCRSGTRCCLLWSLSEAVAGRQTPAQLIAGAAAKGYNIAGMVPVLARVTED